MLTEPGASAAETLVGDTHGSAHGHPEARAQPGRGSPLERGAMVGRYIVLDLLGRGGMGIVYAAYDPELDRRVALKLLLPGRDRGAAARLRLQREAQAIARVSHPNVVAVHDVGATSDQVFIAMELVEGMDLARWLAAEPRPRAEILALFLQAGAGLAAAHAAELVHRDFKPENVLLGRDGRARVVDFGLVRKDEASSSSSTAGGSADALPLEASPRLAVGAEALRLTDAGSLVGTPAYMSPEQLRGQVGDARSDQFSFCVALYEALYGERPFAGESLPELVYAVTRGEVRPPSSQHAVPGRLRQVLLRGLAVEPEARHPSMEALMAAVRQAAMPRRGRWVVAGLVVLAGSAGLWAHAAQEDPCAHAGDRVALVWSPARQAALQQRFVATERSYAADTWQRVQAHVDGYVGQWAAIQQQTCEAAQQLDPAVAAEDPRPRCLDERLDELDDLLTIFGRAEARTVTQAVLLVHGLRALDACASVESSAVLPVPSDPVLREQVQTIRAELRRLELAASAGLSGHDPDAVAALAERAQALGYAPLVAEVLDARAELASARSDYDQAEALYNHSFETALASRHDFWAFHVATSLVFLHGISRRENAEAQRWARRAEALRQRLDNDPHHRVQLLNSWASVHALAGDDASAQALYDEALAIVRELDDPAILATVLNNIGAFHAERRRLDQASIYLEESVVLHDDLLGPDHPNTLRTKANVGVVALMAGRSAEGGLILEEVLPRQEAVLGPDHPEVAVTLEGLSSAAVRAGDLERAERLRRRVLEIRLRTYGPRTQLVLMAKSNLAGTLSLLGRDDEVRALLTELHQDLDAQEGFDSLRVSVAIIQAQTELRAGQPQEALRRAEAGLAACRPGSCLENEALTLRLARGEAKLALGDGAGARTEFAAVLERPVQPFHPWIPGQARFGLARAMLPEDRPAALAMARHAADGATTDDAQSRALVRDIEAWLREQG